jgi:hypothetical protein
MVEPTRASDARSQERAWRQPRTTGGPEARPADHPRDFADLIARHGAGRLRERAVQLLHPAIIEQSDGDGAHIHALDDLDAARAAASDEGDGGGEQELPSWVGVSKRQRFEAVNTPLRRRPRSG